MKKIIIPFLIATLSCAATAHAQSLPPTGCYWVVETGRHDGAKYSIVRFYDSANHLLDTRRIEGTCLRAARPSVQRQLEKMLFLAYTAKNK